LIWQLAASILTILGSYLYGNKSLWGPIVGIAAQVPWWVIMWHGSLWGLAPVNTMMLVIHVRNLWKWKLEIRQSTAPTPLAAAS
jgi:uncharacterized membrane protein